MAITLAELARHIGAQLRGDAAYAVSGVAMLESAGPDELAFVADEKYLPQLAATRAGAVILSAAHADRYTGNALVSDNPHVGFARAAQLLHPPGQHAAGRHPSAVVDARAQIAKSAWIGPGTVIEGGAEVGEHCQIGPGCHVGADARIGAGSRLAANVVVGERCVLGSNCLVHPGAVVGSDGFGYARDGERWVKVPQLGRVVIGDEVEIGANTTIDRGALADTMIGNGVKLDNLIQVAHNVRIGEHTAIAAQVGIAGSAVIGRRCAIGGQAGIIGHLEIADDVHITATSLVTSSIREPGVYSSNLKAVPVTEWRRTVARLGQLDELARRLKKLEERPDEKKGESDT